MLLSSSCGFTDVAASGWLPSETPLKGSRCPFITAAKQTHLSGSGSLSWSWSSSSRLTGRLGWAAVAISSNRDKRPVVDGHDASSSAWRATADRKLSRRTSAVGIQQLQLPLACLWENIPREWRDCEPPPPRLWKRELEMPPGPPCPAHRFSLSRGIHQRREVSSLPRHTSQQLLPLIPFLPALKCHLSSHSSATVLLRLTNSSQPSSKLASGGYTGEQRGSVCAGNKGED